MIASRRAKYIGKRIEERGVIAKVQAEADSSISVILQDQCLATSEKVREWADQCPDIFVLNTFGPDLRAAAEAFRLESSADQTVEDILMSSVEFWATRKPRVRAAV